MMEPNWIVLPILLQVLLTFAVQIVMYRQRFRSLIENKVKLADIAHRHQLEDKLADANGSSNNFKNQFELPIIFYLICSLSLLIQQVDWPLLIVALVFVASRTFHAYIHCTSNRLRLRFYGYLAGTFSLWILTILFAINWLAQLK